MNPTAFNSIFWVSFVAGVASWANRGFVTGLFVFLALLAALIVTDLLFGKRMEEE